MTEEIIIERSLPVNLGYKDAIGVEVMNPAATRISRAALDFYPYFVFAYTLNFTRKDPTGAKHHIQNGGNYILDAMTSQSASNTPGLRSNTMFSYL